jgi:hypothetical protein
MRRNTRKLENKRRTESQPMFLYRVLEWLCVCAEGYFCLKDESILRSDRQYQCWIVELVLVTQERRRLTLMHANTVLGLHEKAVYIIILVAGLLHKEAK